MHGIDCGAVGCSGKLILARTRPSLLPRFISLYLMFFNHRKSFPLPVEGITLPDMEQFPRDGCGAESNKNTKHTRQQSRRGI